MPSLKPSAFRRTALVAAALLASAVFSTAKAALPEVLTKIPGDAYGVIVINNVRTFSNKLSNAATRLSIPLPPDLVGYATRNLGITKGFDANSSVALVLLKPAADHQGEPYFANQPPAILLLPTTDAKGMLEPFTPGEPDKAGIAQVTLPQDPSEKGFVANIDNKWIAFSQSKDDLAAYLARTDSFAAKASDSTKKVFDTNDFVFWGDVSKLSTGTDKMLNDAQTELSGMMELTNLTTNQDPVAGALQKQSFGMGFAFIRQFLKDADASMLTLRLTDSGASVGVVGDFKPDSTIGKFIATQKGAKPITLQGLPTGNFLVAGAASWDPASMATVMKNFTDKLVADEAIAKDPRAADLKSAFDLNTQLLAITSGASFVLLDPPAAGKNGFINGVLLMNTSDPAKFKTLQLEALKSALAKDSMNPDIKQTVTTAADAVTIKGVKLTRINVKISLRPETPDKPLAPGSQQAFAIAQKMYGTEGITAYLGTVGQRAIIIYGSETATLESAIDAAQANTDTLSSSPLIANIKDQVVANPIAINYLPITRWATLAQSILSPGSDVAPSPAIANAPPIVVSAGVTGSSMTAELHVPIATISGAQEAIKRLQAAMSGGAAPGGAVLP